MGKATIGGRHPRRKKKKVVYVTRTKALRYLQIPLGMFRHLCILKGVYPKEPKKRKSGKLTYLFRDIKLLGADPLMKTYRDFNAWLKKLRRATDRSVVHEDGLADSDMIKQENLIKWSRPQYDYDHLVRERYTHFNEALRDLGDCLSLLFMIRVFPATFRLGVDLVKKVARFCDEFTTYVAYAGALEKCFVTLKGIYFQARIGKEAIVWVVPHSGLSLGFDKEDPSQRAASKIQIFRSFVLYYLTLLKFVNYRLYTYMLKLKYPPPPSMLARRLFPDSFVGRIERLDRVRGTGRVGGVVGDSAPGTIKRKDGAAGDVVKLPGDFLATVQGQEQKQPPVPVPAPPAAAAASADSDGDAVMTSEEQPQSEEREYQETFGRSLENRRRRFFEEAKAMFQGMTFYISRECPRPALEFVIRSFGGVVVASVEGQEQEEEGEESHSHASPVSMSISMCLIERDVIPDEIARYECVHPQWVLDSVNAQMRLPLERYRAGGDPSALPPHLSPFVDHEEQGYIPEYAAEIQSLANQRMGIEAPVAASDAPAVIAAAVAEDEEIDDDEAEDVAAELEYQRELQAEREGVSFSEHRKKVEEEKRAELEEALVTAGATAKEEAREAKRREELGFRKIILPSRQRRRVEGLLRREKRKTRKVRKLVKRRAEIQRREREAESRRAGKKKPKKRKREAPEVPKAQADTEIDADADVDAGLADDIVFVVGSDDSVKMTGSKRDRSPEPDKRPKKRQKTD